MNSKRIEKDYAKLFLGIICSLTEKVSVNNKKNLKFLPHYGKKITHKIHYLVYACYFCNIDKTPNTVRYSELI